MQIKRAVEVWEKGMDGALVGRWPVAETISTAFLFRLFAAEQQQADPEMRLGYFLTHDKLSALQPYVAQPFTPDQHDYILMAYGLPEGMVEPAE
ncbi:hypothetical protein [Chitinimonas sp. BJYL2]|uniref:hypothetical protein n=1 Tax=Chitinimonas sp. BJYL2 TaxID=2976696 RepID=UPI0022B43C25|nr:hypothetical protein [Chitinimonas sp. BJYL2]